MMNVTIVVASLFECDSIKEHLKSVNTFDPMWKQTVIGCKILGLLRDLYKFNVSYVYDNPARNVSIVGETVIISHNHNGSNADVLARSMSLTIDLLDHVYPVLAINTWRFGFFLRRRDDNFFTSFYSKPFTRPVWNCLYAMAFLISFLFYFLKRWEFSVVGGWQCSYAYECLMVIAAYCQHIPPIDPKLPSRRIAYFIFFMFSYIVYTFYTSNLLSYLVNDKEFNMDLKTLAQSDYEFVIVDYMRLALIQRLNMEGQINPEQTLTAPVVSATNPSQIIKQSQFNNHNVSIILSKLLTLRLMTVAEGMDAVKMGNVALLSDYTTIYPYIRRTYDNENICKLVSVDLLSSIKKYFFTSKKFKYKEQFKIGTLRIKEVGILRQIVSLDFEEPKCTRSHLIQIRLAQISISLTILICTYVTCFLILVAERIYFKRNEVWRLRRLEETFKFLFGCL